MDGNRIGVLGCLERQEKGGKMCAGQQWQLQGCWRLPDGYRGAKMKMMWLVGLKPQYKDALLSVMAKETSAVTFPVLNAFSHPETRSRAQLGVTGLCRQAAACSPACAGGTRETASGWAA